VMIRRDVFETAGWFDEQLVYLQDIEYFARALRDHSLVMIENPLSIAGFGLIVIQQTPKKNGAPIFPSSIECSDVRTNMPRSQVNSIASI